MLDILVSQALDLAQHNTLKHMARETHNEWGRQQMV